MQARIRFMRPVRGVAGRDDFHVARIRFDFEKSDDVEVVPTWFGSHADYGGLGWT
jgi:hypothetical protein